MQSIIAFVLLLSLRSVSLAADVTVYYDLDYRNAEPGNEPKPIEVSQFPWKFSYHSDDNHLMKIFCKNKSPSVTTINVTVVGTELGTYPAQNCSTLSNSPRKGEEYYNVYFDRHLKPAKMMKLNLYSSNMLCASLSVAEGREVTTIPNEKKAQYYDISREYLGYALVVDLIKKCDDPPLATSTTKSTTTDITSNNNSSEITTNENSAIYTKNAEQPQNLLLYVMIPSVIGTSAVILVIYLLRKKKYCHQSSPPAETMELNTYATANEVVYADLGFVHADSQPPGHDEQSPYAEIIGVLKPTDGNVNNK